MAFCHSGTLFRLPVVNVAMSLEALLPVDPCRLPYPLPWSHRNGHMVSGGGGARCDITKGPALPGPQSPGASADQCTRSHFLSAHHMVPQMVPVLFHGCYLCLHLNVYFSDRESQRNPVEDALQRTLFNSAESTRASPRLAWDHFALAFLHCADVRDSEVGRREWRE